MTYKHVRLLMSQADFSPRVSSDDEPKMMSPTTRLNPNLQATSVLDSNLQSIRNFTILEQKTRQPRETVLHKVKSGNLMWQELSLLD